LYPEGIGGQEAGGWTAAGVTGAGVTEAGEIAAEAEEIGINLTYSVICLCSGLCFWPCIPAHYNSSVCWYM